MNETASLAVLSFAIRTYATLREQWGIGVHVARKRVSKEMPDAFRD